MFQQPSQGDQVKFAELSGSLVLVWVKEYREDVTTVHGSSDAVVCDIHVLDGPKGGEKFENTLVFPKALVGSLRNAAGGEPVLGRVGQGMSKPGQNAPWVLNAFTDADAALATGYIQRMAKPFQAPAANGNAAAPARGSVDISTLPPEVQELLRQTGAIA